MESGIELTRIVTHDDLDGVVSAALVSLALGIDRFYFAGPVNIQAGRDATTESDVVCDLPCPVRVGMWFDHHPGNLVDLELREIDPASIPGKFAAEPSCARVVYDHFKNEVEFPEFMAETVKRTDRIDSFDYRTMEEWREPTPERKLADAMFASSTDRRGYYPFMEKVLRMLRSGSMEEALVDPEVAEMAMRYQVTEEKSLALFQQDSTFHPNDPDHEILVVDLTRHKRKPDVIRSAGFILHPEVKAVLLVGSAFAGGKKTNNLSFSMSLSFLMNREEHKKDIGEIMRELNIGDGHPGAGAGRMDCRSKDEKLRVKEATVTRIIQLWKGM